MPRESLVALALVRNAPRGRGWCGYSLCAYRGAIEFGHLRLGLRLRSAEPLALLWIETQRTMVELNHVASVAPHIVQD